jgi:hypothetical protein
LTPIILNIIQPITHRIRSLCLANRYQQDIHASILSHYDWRSLRYVFITERGPWSIPIHLGFLSSLAHDEISLEIEMSGEISLWFVETMIWDRITSLTIHSCMIY